MKKKTIFVAIICAVLLLTTSVNTVAIRINTDSNKLDSEKEKDFSLNEMGKTYNIDITETDENETQWRFGLTNWIKIQTKGKGLHILIPFKLLHIRAPIITPQYDRFFPLKIDNFAILLVYNDENASTIITQEGEETIYINGSHSILIGMYKMQFFHLLRRLLQNGVIDGFQRLQKHGEEHDKGRVAAAVSKMIDNAFGGPIIDISSETFELLDYLKGTPPRYSPSTPIFDTPKINKIREKAIELFGENLVNYTILPMIRLYAYMFPSAMFWNRMPIRTNLLQIEQTMKCYGYTPFVRWAKTPKLQPMVQNIQELIPDIFYDGPVKFREY